MKKQLEEFELTCTEGDLEEFLKSKLWQDMKTEVTIWRETLRDQLELKSDERLGGAAEACGYFLQLPQVILEDLQSEKETENGRSRKSVE